MVIRYAIGVLAALLGPAQAQQRVVVTEGATVAVPARGTPTTPRPAPVRPRTARPVVAQQAPPTLPPAVALVPLAAAAALAATLSGGDEITTPLLPGFACAVGEVFGG
jgi:hypothetical protein